MGELFVITRGLTDFAAIVLPRQDLCAAVLHSPRFKSAAARDKDGMTASLVRQGALKKLAFGQEKGERDMDFSVV